MTFSRQNETESAGTRARRSIYTSCCYLINHYKPILFGSSSINLVGSRPKISPVAPFHSPTRMPQSLCVSMTQSPTGYAMHNNVNPSFCSSSSKVNSKSVISDWSVAPETHFATHAPQMPPRQVNGSSNPASSAASNTY